MTTYQKFEAIVLRGCREGRANISILEAQVEMGTIESQHDNAVEFQQRWPQYAGRLDVRRKLPTRALPHRSYRSLAFQWLRQNWQAFLTLEAACLTGRGHVNLKKVAREAGITEYNNNIAPTLRRLLLKRNPSLKGRVLVLHRTWRGTEVAA